MSAPLLARPEPRPGVLAIDTYVPGKSGRPGGGKVHKLSSNETPLGPSPAALAALHEATAKLETYPDGRATALRTAIAKRYGLDPERIVCGAGSDELLSLLAYAYGGPGTEGIYSEHGFLVYRIAILAVGRGARGGARARPDRRRRRDPGPGHRAHADRLRHQPQQPHRHLPALRRDPPAACRPAAAGAAGDRRRLRGIRPGQRLLGRPRTRAGIRERRDDPDLLEDPRARRGADRLDGGAAPRRGRGQPHPRPVQRLGTGHRRRLGRHRRRGAHGGGGRPQRRVAAEAHRRRPRPRADRDAERRQLPADPLPRRARPLGGRRRRVPDRARPHHPPRHRLRPAQRPAGDGGGRRGERRPSWRRSAPSCGARMPEGTLPEAREPAVGRLAIVGSRPDRLLDRPGGAALRPRPHDRGGGPRPGRARPGARTRHRRRGHRRRGRGRRRRRPRDPLRAGGRHRGGGRRDGPAPQARRDRVGCRLGEGRRGGGDPAAPARGRRPGPRPPDRRNRVLGA